MSTTNKELDLLRERELFEENVYRAYFLSNIQRNSGGPFELQLSTATKDKAEFCARRPDGYYQFDDVNAAWWAWQERAKLGERSTYEMVAANIGAGMTMQELVDWLSVELAAPNPNQGKLPV